MPADQFQRSTGGKWRHLLLECVLRCDAILPQHEPLAAERVHRRYARRAICARQVLFETMTILQ